MTFLERTDAFQRKHRVAGFPLAVLYKFFDDRGPYLAALVTYYGFVSLFPLLLLFLSALGFFLHGDPHLQQRFVKSALANFPIIGPQLRHNVSGFQGSGVALAIGIAGTLYGGLGVTQAAQTSFNRIYGVPRNEQPNPFKSRLRSLGLLGLLGGAVLLSTGVATLVATANSVSERLGLGLRIAGYAVSFAINLALFTAGFQLLTARRLRIRNVITGGLITAIGWTLLQTEGTRYLSERLNHASEVYGTFGLVLGALAWIYLVALMLMLSAEINVVLHRRLWPRALLTPFTDNVELTPADRRAYRMYVATQRYKGFQRVQTSFQRSAPDESAQAGCPGDSPTDDASRDEATTGTRP